MQPELRMFLRGLLWITLICALLGAGKKFQEPGLALIGAALLYMTIAAAVLRPVFERVTRQKQ